jgi:hypothetical protein
MTQTEEEDDGIDRYKTKHENFFVVSQSPPFLEQHLRTTMVLQLL